MFRKENWFYGALACLALMVSLNADLSAIGEEAAKGGFFTHLAVLIKKLEYVLPVFTYRDGILALLVFLFFHKTDGQWEGGSRSGLIGFRLFSLRSFWCSDTASAIPIPGIWSLWIPFIWQCPPG